MNNPSSFPQEPAPEPSPSSAPSGQAPQPIPTQQRVSVPMPRSAPYVTYSIIGVTAFVFLLQLLSILIFGRSSYGMDRVEAYGALIGSDVRAGQIWRLLTPVLLHDNTFFLHILFNMYALFAFGVSLERYFGHRRFLLLYLLSGFSGNVLSFLISSQRYAYSIGASTAIFGLLGAEGVFLYQNRRLFAGQFRRAIGNIIFIAAINLFVIGSLPGIDNWGHVGGLLGGMIFTSFAGPLWEIEGISPAYHLVDKRSAREVITGAATVVLIFGSLTLWGMTH